MPYTHYDRLTALDSAFLDLESPSVHMHVASVGIFERGPLANDGGVDFERILAVVEAGLRRAPRFRQKLARIPISGRPVWVDDEHFNLAYHVRHTCLPVPGDERLLKRLAGRILSQKLDRSKPMWELWVVEGLEGDRFALITKVHHCLIDGISGVDLLAAFMGPDPEHRFEPSDGRWIPRPRPGPAGLLADEVARRVSLPGRVARGVLQAARRPGASAEAAGHAASGVAESVAKSLSPASETPFNVPIGPHRRFDWARSDLSVVREIKSRVGGTVNDVVLATVAGAVHHYLRAHHIPTDGIDFRVFVPVSTRSDEERGKLGNRVSLIVASLPVDESDPNQRLERVVAEKQQRRRSDQVAGTNAIEEVADWAAPGLLTRFSRMAASGRAFNLVVTNVPGPPIPVYLDGARLLESYPLVPLYEEQALGIALFSYDGVLHWGFNADWDALDDLHEFALGIEEELERLRKG